MKSIIISSVVTALLVLTGCSDKSPTVDDQAQTETQIVEKVAPVQTETVLSDESSVVSENASSVSASDSASDSMSSLENDLSTIYFDFDKFNIRADMQNTLSNDASIANGAASKFSVKLEGNCDEWGSDEYNFALGLKRANTVKKSLVAEGVNANRITMVSFGESNPTCSDKTQECWSKNRRVDFKLLP